MKEAFWGVLIVMLGLLGIVIVNVFQKITVKNDEVYYLIKEVTEASTYDAIDLTYYRLNGDIRIVEDKFVENLTRRFAENVSVGNYTIIVENINETPPQVSLRVNASVSSLQGEEFGITNRVNAIIETKYSKEELLEFLNITEEEWNNIRNNKGNSQTVNSNDDKYCSMKKWNDEELTCIDGDIEFRGWEDTNIANRVCSEKDITEDKRKRKATYAKCKCNKWVEETKEIMGKLTRVGNEITIKWELNEEGELRNLRETIEEKVKIDVCTTDIDIWVPKDLRQSEPSSDNSKYELCGVNGIRIPNEVYNQIVLHVGYIPENATNRSVKSWTNSNKSIVEMPELLQIKKVSTEKGRAKATIKGKKIGVSTITAVNELNQSGVCKINVWDGSVDSVSCKDVNVAAGSTETLESSYEPYNATKTNFKWSISDTDIATINEKTGEVTGKKAGKATITVEASNGKTGTCTIEIKCPSGQSESCGCRSGYKQTSCTSQGNGCYKVSCEKESSSGSSGCSIYRTCRKVGFSSDKCREICKSSGSGGGGGGTKYMEQW